MISLQKNQAISLKKDEKGLDYVKVGLGWNSRISIPFLGMKIPVPFDIDVDIDATVLVYNKQNKCIGECSYRNLRLLNRSRVLINHHGDERTGGNKGDDEVVDIYLDEMSKTEAVKAYIVLNIFSPKITFNWIQKAYIKVYDNDNKELASYNLSDDYAGKNGIIVARIDKTTNGWNLTPLGDGVNTTGIDKLKRQAISF